MFRISIFGSSGSSRSCDYSCQLIGLGVLLSDYRIEVIVGSTTGVVGFVLDGIKKGKRNCIVKLISYGDPRYIDSGSYDQLVVKEDYFSRLKYLCESDAFISLDGHLGTMAETIVAWNVLQSKMETKKKIFVFWENKENKVKLLRNQLSHLKNEYLNIVVFTSSAREIIDNFSLLIKTKQI